MRTLNLRLAHLASTSLLLLFLVAALFGLGAHLRAASHAMSVNAHHALAYDDPPPGH